MPTLLLATRNEHKRREFARLLPGWEWTRCPMSSQLPPEDGATFADNALGKARAAAAATGRVSIADDSGIEAAALGGRAGGALSPLRGGARERRGEPRPAVCARRRPAVRSSTSARSRTWTRRRATERVFEGRCTGTVAAEPRGERGFGYDPAFLPDDRPADGTMAELTDEQKDAISHRGRAARALLAWLAH